MTLEPHLELRAVLAEIMPEHRAEWGHADSWDSNYSFQRALAAEGWTAPAWPVELGGRGLTVEEQIACDVEFARADCPTQVSVFGVNNVGPTIAAVGTPEQREHLKAIVTADEIWCQGFSEPDAGSDLAGLRTRAEADGDGFRITGQKVWTSVGLWASHCMLLVRTDPEAPKHRGISALLLPLDLPGVDRRPIKQINGKAEFAEMHFDNVWVPRTALLGPIHEGWRVTMTTLGFERAGVIAMAGRMADDVSRIATPEMLAGASPIVRDRAMRLVSEGRIMSWLGKRALIDVGPDGAPGPLSSVIKLAFSHLHMGGSEFRFDEAGMDAVAGIDADAVERLLTSRASSIAGGTTEVLKSLIGERALGLPKEPSGKG